MDLKNVSRKDYFEKYLSQEFNEEFFDWNKYSNIHDDIDIATNIILEYGEGESFEKSLKKALKYYKDCQPIMELDVNSEAFSKVMEIKTAIEVVYLYSDDEGFRYSLEEIMKKYSISPLENCFKDKEVIYECIAINRALQNILKNGDGERLNRTMARILVNYSTFLPNLDNFYVDPDKLNKEMKNAILSKSREIYNELNKGINKKLSYEDKIVAGINSIGVKKEEKDVSDEKYQDRPYYNDALAHFQDGVFEYEYVNYENALLCFDKALKCLDVDDGLESNLAKECHSYIGLCNQNIEVLVASSDDENIEKVGEKEYKFGKYAGDLLCGIEHGKGIFYFNDGRVIEGVWEQGECIKGKCKYPEAGEYTGSFHNLKKHGEGVFVTNKGFTFIGKWKDDFFDGEIMEITPDGDEIKHLFKDGVEVEKAKAKVNVR